MAQEHGSPGDLGRRIAYHRKNLGLSRAELAARAGMAPGFIAYLEEHATPLTEGTLLRLAAALHTTADELLGGGLDRPPGQGRPPRLPETRALPPRECLRLISPGGIGRVAFGGVAGAPAVLPVNYMVRHGAIFFRTAEDGLLDRLLRAAPPDTPAEIGFEVDHIDEAERGGWSVLVQGPACRLTPAESPKDPGVEPWVGGERDVYVRVTPRQVTGRRVHGF
ncbi:helix-turn-helix domain-containing protein [Sphaerisporangium aureirubrum]|uniref:Helix-turn-helix domain-containing protein n=1 Tax=Sphaerisporangium aureirubrum TaxID=1544736 RepID=A0ABW1NI70_9ACTN